MNPKQRNDLMSPRIEERSDARWIGVLDEHDDPARPLRMSDALHERRMRLDPKVAHEHHRCRRRVFKRSGDAFEQSNIVNAQHARIALS